MSEAMAVGVPRGGPDLTRYWWLPLVGGLLTMLCGFVALVFPEPTLVFVSVIFGIYLLLWGFMAVVRGVFEPVVPSGGSRILYILIGVLSLLAGLVVIMRPSESVLAVAWILAFWWVISGILHLVRAIADAEGRAVNIFEGLIGIVGGTIVLASPHIGVVTLLIIVGVGLLLQGAAEVFIGWQLRSLRRMEGAA